MKMRFMDRLISIVIISVLGTIILGSAALSKDAQRQEAATLAIEYGFSSEDSFIEFSDPANSYGQTNYYFQASYYFQSAYYFQAAYYSQGNYYNQSAYYSQNSYYSQASYYGQSSYYSQNTYYFQSSYADQGFYETPASPPPPSASRGSLWSNFVDTVENIWGSTKDLWPSPVPPQEKTAEPPAFETEKYAPSLKETPQGVTEGCGDPDPAHCRPKKEYCEFLDDTGACAMWKEDVCWRNPSLCEMVPQKRMTSETQGPSEPPYTPLPEEDCVNDRARCNSFTQRDPCPADGKTPCRPKPEYCAKELLVAGEWCTNWDFSCQEEPKKCGADRATEVRRLKPAHCPQGYVLHDACTFNIDKRVCDRNPGICELDPQDVPSTGFTQEQDGSIEYRSEGGTLVIPAQVKEKGVSEAPVRPGLVRRVMGSIGSFFSLLFDGLKGGGGEAMKLKGDDLDSLSDERLQERYRQCWETIAKNSYQRYEEMRSRYPDIVTPVPPAFSKEEQCIYAALQNKAHIQQYEKRIMTDEEFLDYKPVYREAFGVCLAARDRLPAHRQTYIDRLVKLELLIRPHPNMGIKGVLECNWQSCSGPKRYHEEPIRTQDDRDITKRVIRDMCTNFN